MFLGAVFVVPLLCGALEVQKQLDNDFVSISKVVINPHEEIGLHRDAAPQVVVALKGGTITRLEADGSEIDVQFPEGVAVFRPVDPIDQLHKSVNRGDQSIELILIELKRSKIEH